MTLLYRPPSPHPTPAPPLGHFRVLRELFITLQGLGKRDANRTQIETIRVETMQDLIKSMDMFDSVQQYTRCSIATKLLANLTKRLPLSACMPLITMAYFDNLLTKTSIIPQWITRGMRSNEIAAIENKVRDIVLTQLKAQEVIREDERSGKGLKEFPLF